MYRMESTRFSGLPHWRQHVWRPPGPSVPESARLRTACAFGWRDGATEGDEGL